MNTSPPFTCAQNCQPSRPSAFHYSSASLTFFFSSNPIDAPVSYTHLSRAYLDGADPIGFSIDFSPYAEGRIIPLGTTDQVSIPAQYGACYTVILSGDEATGFQAELQ